MAKTTTAGMDSHLLTEVTTLAMAVIIERTDGVKFHLTTSSEDIKLDVGDGDGEQNYSASESVSRTNIENDAELNVDNLDLIGIFDNVMLKETELRRGLFDFSDFKIFVFNHQKLADGIIKIFRGQFGEVIVSPTGFFQVQVRSLVQVYSKQTGEHYSKDCRADLGDLRCRVPILPDELKTNTALTLGDFFIIPTAPTNNDCSPIIMNFEGLDGATSGVGFDNIGTDGTQPSLLGDVQIDTAQAPAGGDSTSSMLFDGVGDRLFWTDRAAWTMGSAAVTIHMHFRLGAVDVDQCLASQWTETGDQRSWLIRVTAANVLEFEVSANGSTTDITLTGTTALTVDTDHHAAAVRKSNGDWVLFLDGGIEAGPTTPSADPFDSDTFFRLGALQTTVVTEDFNGHIDSFEFLVGFARWETTFTPPTGNLSATNPDLTLNWPAFGQRVYEVTVAGTTGNCINIPNTTLLGTHSQGGATMTAFNSWMREAIVSAVDGTEPRRKFTVTELTPISGQTVNSNSTPNVLGFPNDWFNGGAAFFETGNNAKRVNEIRDFVEGAATQNLELFTDLPFDVVVGDVLRLFPGCDKTNAICISKFNNGINFVGEPYVPGEDVLGQYPDAH